MFLNIVFNNASKMYSNINISNFIYVLNVIIYSNVFEIEFIIKARGMNLFAKIFCCHVSQTTIPRKFLATLSFYRQHTLIAYKSFTCIASSNFSLTPLLSFFIVIFSISNDSFTILFVNKKINFLLIHEMYFYTLKMIQFFKYQ